MSFPLKSVQSLVQGFIACDELLNTSISEEKRDFALHSMLKIQEVSEPERVKQELQNTKKMLEEAKKENLHHREFASRIEILFKKFATNFNPETFATLAGNSEQERFSALFNNNEAIYNQYVADIEKLKILRTKSISMTDEKNQTKEVTSQHFERCFSPALLTDTVCHIKIRFYDISDVLVAANYQDVPNYVLDFIELAFMGHLMKMAEKWCVLKETDPTTASSFDPQKYKLSNPEWKITTEDGLVKLYKAVAEMHTNPAATDPTWKLFSETLAKKIKIDLNVAWKKEKEYNETLGIMHL